MATLPATLRVPPFVLRYVFTFLSVPTDSVNSEGLSPESIISCLASSNSPSSVASLIVLAFTRRAFSGDNMPRAKLVAKFLTVGNVILPGSFGLVPRSPPLADTGRKSSKIAASN